jgi:flagellar hook assembly protein FlgD
MTTIEFALPGAVHVELSVYDTAGRRVRTITSGFQPAGVHRVTWDGKDDAGLASSSGVYFYRLVAGARVLNGRMTLLR